jgi:hypothetical protein
VHDELMIANQVLRVVPGSEGQKLCFDLRLPWYRSLPISCVEKMEFVVDGRPLSRDSVTMAVGGILYDLDGVGRLADTQWFVLDTYEVFVHLAEALTPGNHHVKLTTQLRIPYKDDSYEETEYLQFAVCEKNYRMEAC